jgi:hypothetical protein
MKGTNAFVVKVALVSLLIGVIAGFVLGQKYVIRVEERGGDSMLGMREGGDALGGPDLKGAGGSTAGSSSDGEGELVEGKHCVVSYDGVEKKWADAFAKIYDAVYQGYAEVLGMTLPETTYIEITVTGEPTVLYTDGNDRFFLKLERPDDLLPTSKYKNVYGFAHEPGHIAMYSKMSTTAGLPDGVGEGWAHYCGSVILDYVFDKLGKEAYPVPYDYSIDGTKRLKKQAENPGDDAVNIAAAAFFKLGEKYGHDKVGQAMNRALEGKPSGAELMPLFRDAAAGIMGNDAASMIPDSILMTQLRWETKRLDKGGEPQRGFFDTQKTIDGWLAYDDGSNESMRSTAGSGHAVLFRKRDGGKLTSVQVMGGRYGMPETQSEFRITILDTAFSEISQKKFPFMAFARSQDLEWRSFDMKDVIVPECFFVCVDFNPTATDGVYVGIDKSGSGHSFSALPGDHLCDFDDGEWTIRALVD